MRFSAQQFTEIVEQLDADVLNRNRASSDKRRANRVELRHRATIVPYVGGVRGIGVGVEVRDFSPRGVRFLHSEKMPRSSQFVLELPQQPSERIQILCTVMHCEDTDEGPISIGAEFTCVLRKGKPVKPAPTVEKQRLERDRIRKSILER